MFVIVARKLIAVLPVLAGLSGVVIDASAPFGRFTPTGDSILVTGMHLVVDVFPHHSTRQPRPLRMVLHGVPLTFVLHET